MPKQLNLLSLDGGGVRGLSSLFILQKLMQEINPDNPPKPCDYFDMIGGTSTGGIIAIMLGRLGMTVAQCIKKYVELSEVVFVKEHRFAVTITGKIQERYNSGILAREIQKVVKEYTAAEDTLLKSDGDHGCKVFVCATSEGVSKTELITTYRRPQGDTDLYQEAKIWEAARATSAASTFFDPITIGSFQRRFLDGGTGANNPVQVLWIEAQKVFCPEEPLEPNINCLVSIGTGVPSLKNYGKNLTGTAKTIMEIVTETEATARIFHDQHANMFEDDICYRFNAPDVGDIDMDEAEGKTEIADKTMYYFNSPADWRLIVSCVKQLAKREMYHKSSLSQTLCIMSTYNLCLNLTKRKEWKLDSSLGLEEYNVFEEISDYDPERTLKRLSNKCEGTTTWILSHSKYRDWLTEYSGSCLWLYGIVGSGKTTIATTVVEDLNKTLSDKSRPVCHYFFETSQRRSLNPADVLESFAKQLLGHLGQSNGIPKAVHHAIMSFYCPRPKTSRSNAKTTQLVKRPDQNNQSYKEPSTSLPQRPSIKELMSEILLPLMRSVARPIFIIDGLDECNNQKGQRTELLRIFKDMVNSGASLLIASREEVFVSNYIDRTVSIRIAKEDEDVFADVLLFIDAEISRNMSERTITDNENVILKIRQTLMDKTDAMFLWAKLIIDGLWLDCHNDADILWHLDHLPKDLDDTYQRCLKRLSIDDQAVAHKILRWVCAAIVPLHREEIRDALSFDPLSGLIDQSRRPVEARLLRCGANLLVIDEKSAIVPAHHSVRQWIFPHDRIQQNREHVERELGEMLVHHLFSRLRLEKQERRRLHEVATITIPRTPYSGLIAKFTGTSCQERFSFSPYLFHTGSSTGDNSLQSYAQNYWMQYTRSFSSASKQWENWKFLVLNQSEGAAYPWRRVGQSIVSHIVGLLGWTIEHDHRAAFELIATSGSLPAELASNMARIGFWNLPLLNYCNSPPLLVAAKHCRLSMLGTLSNMCNISQQDDGGNTILHAWAAAILDPNWSDVNTLLRELARKNGKTVCNIKNLRGETALHIAAINGSETPFFALVSCTDTKIIDKEMNHILHSAAQGGNTDIIKHIRAVCPGAERSRNMGGETPFEMVVNDKQIPVETIVPLIDKSRVLQSDGDGVSPLMYAYNRERYDIIIALLRILDRIDRGYASNERQVLFWKFVSQMNWRFGIRPLQAIPGLISTILWTDRTISRRLIELLVRAPQELSVSELGDARFKLSVIDGIRKYISSSGDEDVFDLFLELMPPFLQKVTIENVDGLPLDSRRNPILVRLMACYTTLDYTALKKNVYMSRELVRLIRLEDWSEAQQFLMSGEVTLFPILTNRMKVTTPLAVAFSRSSFWGQGMMSNLDKVFPAETQQWLRLLNSGLEEGSKHGLTIQDLINFPADDGLTPLQSLCRLGPDDCVAVEELIQLGANVNATSEAHESALWLAASRGNGKVVRLLLPHGAALNAHNAAGQSLHEVALANGHEEVAHLLEDHDHGVVEIMAWKI